MSMFKPKTPQIPTPPPPPNPATAAGSSDPAMSRAANFASRAGADSLLSASPSATLARKASTAKTSLIGGA